MLRGNKSARPWDRARSIVLSGASLAIVVSLLSADALAAPTKVPPVTLGPQTLTGDGSPPTAFEFFRQTGSSWKGDIAGFNSGVVYSLRILGINATGVTGPADRFIYFNLQDAETGSTFKNLGINAHLDSPGAGGGTLLQCYQNFTGEGSSSHGLNPGALDLSNFGLRFDFTRTSSGAPWAVTPYFKSGAGAWTPFFGGSFTATVPFDFLGAKLVVAFDGGADGTLSFQNYYLQGPPSSAWVDDNWTALVEGDPVTVGSVYHTIGVDAFAAIQPGVNAVQGASATVNVAAGTYPETVTIPKSLMLQGAGAASTSIDASSLPTAGNVVSINGITANITVDGFTVITGPASTVVSNAVSISNVGAGSLITFTNDVLTCVQSASGTAMDNYGLIAGYGSQGHLVFDHNTVNGGGDNPVLLERWVGPVDFTYNTIIRGPDDNLTAGKDAMFVMNYGASNITAKQKFDHNTFDMGGGTIFDNAHRGAALSVVAQQTGGSGPGGYTDVEITNNTVLNLKPYRRGIGLWDNSSGPGDVIAVIRGNTLSAAPSYTGDHGIRLLGGISNTVIRENDISGCDIGVQLRNWNSLDPTGAVVIGNSLAGNTKGVDNLMSAGSVNASGNWWGTTSEAAVIALVNGSVDFTPWIHNAGDTSPDPGFQGDFSVLDVSAAGAQTGTVIRIQEGIDMVTASTVNVLPGNYPGNVIVSTKVILNGSGDGNNPLVDTILLPASGAGITIQAGGASASDRCEIRNLRVSGGQFSLYTGSVFSYLTLQNLTLTGSTAQGFEINNAADINDLVMTDVDVVNNLSSGMRVRGKLNGLTITNGHIDGNQYGLQSYTAPLEGNNFLNVNVTGTTFNNNVQKGMYFEKLSDAVFDGIMVTNSGTAGGHAAGIDINLKYTSYQNIEIRNSTFTSCGTGDATNGAGLMIKARDDAPSYSTYPASLTNVDLTNNTITGCQNGIRFGEPAKNNAGPTVVDVHQNAITGSLGMGLVNVTLATPNANCNWWGNILGPNVVPGNPSPGDGITGSAIYAPWLNAAPPGGVCNQYGNNFVSANTTGLCISTATPCVSVPMLFTHADPTPVRGVSVKVQLDPAKLQLCAPATPATNFHMGGWLVGTVQMQVTDNGGGLYTVDQVSLGTPCGATGNGLLFTMDVKALDGDGTGTITVTSVLVRDCSNLPLAGIPGPPSSVSVDQTAPAGITSLAAAQRLTGNDADGTTKIDLSWAAVETGATVEIWRAGWGNYPEYDDVGGGVPATPAWNATPPSPWVLAATVTSGTTYADEVAWPSRDFWYYVAFVKDGCGNVSAVSNKTTGTLNYHLGDVTPAPGAGDNKVQTVDISLLGANYGVSLTPVGDPRNYLDVGPTTNYLVSARPTTDNKIDFEDLMMFAVNYGQVTAPEMVALAPSDRDELALEAPGRVAAGEEFAVTLRFMGTGSIQGLSTQLAWDASVCEPVAVEAGALMAAQGVVLSARAGNADAAALGQGRGIAGDGVLATVRFRARTAGDPRVVAASLEARDTKNQAVVLATSKPVVPGVTAFAPAMPNPFSRSTTLSFTLAKAGPAELAIYSVDGRKVATVANGFREAGAYRLSWDGMDAQGQLLKPGMFFARLATPEGRFTRTLVLTK